MDRPLAATTPGMNRARSVLTLVSTCAIACASAEEPDDRPVLELRKANAAPDNGKVALCHVAGGQHHTIVVAAPAIPAHVGHGDTVGECASGCTTESCNDGNACTTDACLPDGTCAHTVVDCNDGNACTIDSCDPAGGCVAAPADGIPCEDGNECTDDDVCCVGMCRGTPIAGCCLDAGDCDDDNACSTDVCSNHACSNTPVACADADPCVVGFCDPTTGECDGAPVSCDDGNACTIDTCGAQGCVHTRDIACGTNANVVVTPSGAVWDVAMSGARVVWSLSESGSFEVMMHDLDTGTTQNISNTPGANELDVGIDGDRVVWQRHGGSAGMILHDLASGSEELIEARGANSLQAPTIDGNFVAYLRSGSIAVYDLDLRALLPSSPLLADAERLTLRDGRILYTTRIGSQLQLRLFTIASGTSVAIGNAMSQVDADTDGTRVVYAEFDGYSSELFVYDIASATTQSLEVATSVKNGPQIDGNRIVWLDQWDEARVGVYDLATGESAALPSAYMGLPMELDGDRMLYSVPGADDYTLAVFTFTDGV